MTLRRAAAWPPLVGVPWSLLIAVITGTDRRPAVALGVVLGVVAEGLLRLHGRRTVARALGAVVVLHALLLAWALADTPELYAPSFYARGGALRAVQLLATDVLGPSGVIGLAAALAIAFARPWRLLAAALAITGACAPVPPAAERPGIVVVTVDGLDAIDARVTPALAALAATSTRFDRASRTGASWQAPLAERLVAGGYRIADPSPRRGLRSLVHAALGHPEVVGDVVAPAGGAFVLETSYSTAAPVAAPYYGRFTSPSYRGRFKYPGLAGDAFDDADRAQLHGLHEGALAGIDEALARLRARLDPATILVVVGRETFLVHAPRHAPGRSAQVVRDIDLAPTILELAGLDAPAGEARSLVPALRGEPLRPVLAFTEGTGPLALRTRSVRDDRWTLTYTPTRAGVAYRLLADDGIDVAAGHPDDVARLRAELWRWMLATPGRKERDGYVVAQPDVPANVLWIVADALPADVEVPRGTRFTRAYTTSTDPAASLRAMLAGARVPAGEGPLALLRSVGVSTHAFVDDGDPGPGFDAVHPAAEAAAFLDAPRTGRFFALVRVAREDIGRRLAALATEDTIVVFTAARGASTAEDREAAIHVPLVIAAAGLAPAPVDAPWRTIDVMPTILELLGLETRATSVRVLYADGSRGAHALVHDHWHLVVRDDAAILHDLSRAPDVDVAREHPEIVAELRARLVAAVAGVPVADARDTAARPPPIRLRFVGGDGPHRVTGTIRAHDASVVPVELGPEAVRREGDRIDIAFRTDPRTTVGLDLVAAEATWELWLDDVPLVDVFGGADGLRAPALVHGITTHAARAAAAAPALPFIDPGRERGLFVVR